MTPERFTLRRIINRLAAVLLLAAGRHACAEFTRASHLCTCEHCGDTYAYHVSDPFEPWLTVLCDGRRVKL